MMTIKMKIKRYALLTFHRRSHCKDIYINNDARYCFKNQLRSLNKKKTFKSTVITQRQQSEEFTKIVFTANNIYMNMKSINKTLIIIFF